MNCFLAISSLLVLALAVGRHSCMSVSDDKRVIGGERMRAGEMPWLVAIAYHYPDGKVSACGAALIEQRFLLTAAHCVYDSKNRPLKTGPDCPECRWTARLGTDDLGFELEQTGRSSFSEDTERARMAAFRETKVFRDLERTFDGVTDEENQGEYEANEEVNEEGTDAGLSEYANTDDEAFNEVETNDDGDDMMKMYQRLMQSQSKKRSVIATTVLLGQGSYWQGHRKRSTRLAKRQKDIDVIYDDDKTNPVAQASDGTLEVFETEVVEIIAHPQYNTKTLKNDIALMKLKTTPPASVAKFVSKVKLPTDDMVGNFPTPQEVCMFAGWGCEHSGSGLSAYANKVNLTLRRDAVCEAIYETDIDSTKQICAGTLGDDHKGTCPGDSGGPLICAYDGDWYQAGVLSYGMGGKEAYYPPVFTRVTHYLDWIKTAIGTANGA